MNPVWLAIVIIALFAAAAFLAIWTRRDTRGRAMAMVLFAVGIPTTAAAMVESLGHHKPVDLAWDLPAGEHLVLAAKLVQDRAIYLYLDDPERVEPRPLVLPWSNEQANAMQRAIDGAPDGMEGKFIVKLDGTPDGEMTAHAIPQRAEPPAKDTPEPGLVYEQE